MFFLRKLSTFKVCNVLIIVFYQCFIESVLTYCCVAWFSSLSLSNKNRPAKLVKVASKIIVVQQTQVHGIYIKRVWNKAKSIHQKISSKSLYNFPSNVVHRETDNPTPAKT